MRRIITAREQLEMLSQWMQPLQIREAIIKVARYPQEYRGGHAPYGYLSNSNRARNRPPSVRRNPDNKDEGIVDPSEIRYEYEDDDSVSAYHPNGAHLGNYSWTGGHRDGEPPHIGVAQVNPKYQGQGVAGAIIDHIRENYAPDLVHSGYRGLGSLSYQGRAGALRDLGNTEEEHNDYFNTTPYNYGSNSPVSFSMAFRPTPEQQAAHEELMRQFEEDQQHPNFTGRVSNNPHDPDMYDEDGDKYEFGYDSNGDYVGLHDGFKDSEGYSQEGYNQHGYDRDGFDSDGYDEDDYDEEGFSRDTGLNRDGETRHGYTPGRGEAPEGTIPMSQMASHWAQNGLPTSEEHQQMMDDAGAGVSPTMYAVRQPHQRSPHDGSHHVGNGDTLYSSLDRARQMAYHPDDPRQDKDIVRVDYLNTDALHTDASGKTPEDFHYAPVSGFNQWSNTWDDDAEDTASVQATIFHDPQRHERILGDLGHGWSMGTLPYSSLTSMEYTDPNGGRSGRIWQQPSGLWRSAHQPEFGSERQQSHPHYRDAADAVIDGTRPGKSMEDYALELNNDYHGSGQGSVNWEPRPNGLGLMARTPHGDLHLAQDPINGAWNYYGGPHGSRPGDPGNIRSMWGGGLNSTARSGIQAITRRPFHAQDDPDGMV